jgi:hypothetical protein
MPWMYASWTTAVSAFSERRRAPGRRESSCPSSAWGCAVQRCRPRFPVALAVTVTLGEAVTSLLAITRADHAADFQIHPSLRGKAYHLTREIRTCAHFPPAPAGSSYRRSSKVSFGRVSQRKPSRRSSMATREPNRPLQRWMIARGRSASLPLSYTPGGT